MSSRPDTRAQELLEQGASLYEAGKLYEALACWKRVIELEPTNEIAAEYLRFVEDNFQIGVEAFIDHHSGNTGPLPGQISTEPSPAPAPPLISSAPPRALPPPLPSETSSVNSSLGLDFSASSIEESIEELDWSELLEQGADALVPPPQSSGLRAEGDEDFFVELQPGSIAPQPGQEAAAWGATRLVEETPPVADGAAVSEDLEPMLDPLTLPVEHFAAPYRPPASSGHGSVSQEILPGEPGSRGHASQEAAAPRKDVTEMSDDSIEVMLDDDFRVWEDGAYVSGSEALVPEDSTDLEVLLSQGMSLDGVGSVPLTPPPNLEPMVSSALASLDATEFGGEAPRQLITAPPPDTDFDALMIRARQKQRAGDFTGSLELVELVLAGAPDHAEAQQYLAKNTIRLLAMYRSKLGDLKRRPSVKLRPQEIIWQSLDHRAGFVLSQVDGQTSYEEIMDISGMSELDATRILARLVEHGVIG